MSDSPLAYLDRFAGSRAYNDRGAFTGTGAWQVPLRVNTQTLMQQAELAAAEARLAQQMVTEEMKMRMFAAQQQAAVYGTSSCVYQYAGGALSMELLSAHEMLVEPAERPAPTPAPWPWPRTSAAELAQRAHRARIRRLVNFAVAVAAGALSAVVVAGLVFG